MGAGSTAAFRIASSCGRRWMHFLIGHTSCSMHTAPMPLLSL